MDKFTYSSDLLANGCLTVSDGRQQQCLFVPESGGLTLDAINGIPVIKHSNTVYGELSMSDGKTATRPGTASM